MFMFKIRFNRRTINIRTYKTDNVRVRFAPSPTGFLHLGGLRTALYNFLFAKKHNGKFILRIEDTDQTRIVQGATEQIQEDLAWSGIEIDEGPTQGGDFGPYLQSQRLQFYKEHMKILLENGSAYHCFCTERRLQLLRKEAMRLQQIPKYDNRCRHLSLDMVQKRLANGETSCIRFKLSDKEETFNDLIYGKISYNTSLTEGDPIIVKSDGFPTYHFANVVDDHLMKISHVLRGVEWQISTNKHIMLYRAFNWDPPLFGHLPLLMNADGTKLSKRQNDIKLSYYKENSIFPVALINFIVHSGGGFTKDLEQNIKPRCYTIAELSEQFDISRINSHSGKLMSERLLEFNRLELKRQLQNEFEEKVLIEKVKEMLQTAFPQSASENLLMTDEEHIRKILHWSANRIDRLSDLFSNDFKFLWIIPTVKSIPSDEVNLLKLLKINLENEDMFSRDDLNIFLKKFCKENDVKYSKFMKLLRSVLSGLKEGPGVAEMVEIIGKESALQRIETCLSNSRNV